MEEDLNKKLEALLSSPDTMAKVGQMMASLGQETPALPTATASPAPLLSLLKQDGGNDRDAVLLRALRPYLHGQRAERLSTSLQVMELMRLLPLFTKGGGLL